MNVLFVASELAPFAKTGGLADVMAALPKYLHGAGHDVRVVLPLYDTMDRTKVALRAIATFDLRLGTHRYDFTIFQGGEAPPVYFVACPALYSRGRLYTSEPDEHRRFLGLAYAALMICHELGFTPDIIHAHDWQAALLPMIVKANYRDALANVRTLLTIHNLNYQGSFPATVVPDTNLAPVSQLFHQELLRAGRVNFLLQGILFADGVSTVSPTYANEIQTAEHGAGLDAFLRARSSTVVGILNGVDYDEWSPEHDRQIPHAFSATDLAGKSRDKQALLANLGLPYLANVPVIGIVSRLVGQKGFGLLEPAMFDLVRRHGFQLVVLGSGEPALENLFTRLQHAFPRQVCFFQGFQNQLAHLIEAGSDMFLMPSKYEPCGLNQMYSLRYGTVPIVHRTGGLADTVEQWNPRTGAGNGFLFDHHDEAGLRWAVEAALAAYREPAQWQRLIQNGMAADFSWDAQGKLYELVYDRLRRDARK
ncbi:MAG: glycogen synthase [Kofleriaceae bacterium]